MKHEPELKPLTVGSLIVDIDVQRTLDTRRVDKIAGELNMDALGTITVSHRTNGSYHIIDGQHRVSAVRLINGDDEKILCRVFTGLAVEEEAEMFRLLNNTAKPQALDLFRVRIVEREEAAVAIYAIISRHGWQLGAGATANLAAVSAIERLWRRDADALDKAVATVTRAWGRDAPANDGRLIEGIGLVFARYGAAVEVTGLVSRLSSFSGGPGGLLGKAKGLQDMLGGTQPNAVAEIVVETFNRNRKTRALQPWRS